MALGVVSWSPATEEDCLGGELITTLPFDRCDCRGVDLAGEEPWKNNGEDVAGAAFPCELLCDVPRACLEGVPATEPRPLRADRLDDGVDIF